MVYDIIILGSGPAGLTSALYGTRANKKVLVLGGTELGGQMGKTVMIENYPGFTGSGMELSNIMKKQAETFGAEIRMENATKIERHDSNWIVHTAKENLEAKVVIIATGAKPRLLMIPGTRELIGRGVSYCATCDGFFYSDKTVAVYGGGNSALSDALYLANLCQKVYIIYRRSAFTRAESILVDRVNETKNIECIFNTEISGLISNESGLTGIKTNTDKEIPLDGLFIAIGHEANTDFLSEEFKRDHEGKIISEKNSAKVIDNLFVAGDVRSGSSLQIAVATGWGCEAAMDAVSYLNKIMRAQQNA